MTSDSASQPSMLGRLLDEISWSGASVRQLRGGGQGLENVLTAEVFAALDLLPRSRFLAAVVAAARGADAARAQLGSEAELAELELLPGDWPLAPPLPGHQAALAVQPDAVIRSPSSLALIEAKRIRRSVFQPEQLAREYVAVLQHSSGRTPLLLLILGAEPPIPVRGAGSMNVDGAIRAALPSVLSRTTYEDADAVARGIGEVTSWITWAEIARVVAAQMDSFTCEDASVRASIARLADSVTDAVRRHS